MERSQPKESSELKAKNKARLSMLDDDQIVRKRAEEAEERINLVIESVPNALVMVDETGKIHLINKATEVLFGYNREELLVMNVDALVPQRFREKHPENRNKFHKDPKARSMGAGRDLYGLKKDGIEVPIEIGLSPIRTEKGSFVLASIADISERKHAEKRVQIAKNYAENIIATVKEPLVVLNSKLLVVSANRSFYTNFRVTPVEIEGQRIYDIGNRQWDIPKLRELFEKILPQNTVIHDFQVKHYFETIGLKTMLLNARKIIQEEEEEELILLTIEDVTERRQAEEKLKKLTIDLERSNRDLEQFAYVASHDLQEPLRKIVSFGDLLKTEFPELLKGGSKEYVERMQKASKRMRQLIDGILKYSKVITKGGKFEEVNLEKVVREVLSDLEIRIKETGAHVETDSLPTVNADRLQMRQLFQNLIINGLKFQQENKTPHLRIVNRRLSDKIIEIMVQDNGIGFDEKYLDQIFIPFERLNRKIEFEGVGMGLAICQRIVLRHYGEITAKSILGQGSSFIIKLPVNYQEGVISDGE